MHQLKHSSGQATIELALMLVLVITGAIAASAALIKALDSSYLSTATFISQDLP